MLTSHGRTPRRRRWALALTALLTAVAVAAPAAAQAACPVTPTTKPFAPFGDQADYSPVADGGLEAGGAGWWRYRASVVDENESFHVGAASDTRSMEVRGWGSALTPQTCVGAEHPTFRFFARSTESDAAALRVSVVYLADGDWREKHVAQLSASDFAAWAPSPSIDLYSQLGLTDPTATTTARLRFSVAGSEGAWRIDDVYLDPWRY
jgi:hypothetical protein